jgi:hypothetical protein
MKSAGEIEIRAAHEIMAARTTQLALLVDQLMPALQTKPPMLAGNVFGRWRGASIGRRCRFVERVLIHFIKSAKRTPNSDSRNSIVFGWLDKEARTS